MNTEIVQDALRIKKLLGIVNEQFHPKGVGENDIFIIATACVHKVQLVSNENRQNNLPVKLAKYNIPAVCAMQDVSVPCVNFIEFLKRSGQVFG